ncbi:1-phosphofructokinase family hexose kinase [uncultured Arthrobacter sp.]|uniref:1-phosphofructokinase family hexose kinase n=1 Tax=uncultured Arthrobacter sp. TaxID=114050 RepID=UPI002615115C|nr:1-phosphofructokinase family hexose kinase [uncultured Arthrobacter sp.]
MILTLTTNPSVDRTVELDAPLERGAVQRAVRVSREAGGKGVNVSRALAMSGVRTLAVLPGDDDDPVLAGLRTVAVPFRNLPIGADLRTNTAITEADGTTTKINEPGPVLTGAQLDELLAVVVAESGGAHWLVLAGSLPPGVPPTFYTRVIAAVREAHGPSAPLVAIDSSGEPLSEGATGFPAPDLLKPNAEELAELTGIGTAHDLEEDHELAASACAVLVSSGVGAVLATLGSRGALLVTSAGAWHGIHSPVTARSTVGAGDSALAGYLLAHSAGELPENCLRQAVAHGSAAAALPGSTVPSLEQTSPAEVSITAHTITLPVIGTHAGPGSGPTAQEEL